MCMKGNNIYNNLSRALCPSDVTLSVDDLKYVNKQNEWRVRMRERYQQKNQEIWRLEDNAGKEKK